MPKPALLLASTVDNWTMSELKDSLIEMITHSQNPSVNIFIDALDEGDQESDIRQMVDFIDQLAAHALPSSSKLRVCLSSRHYPHISISRGLSITLEHQVEHAKDIKTYADHTLRGDEKDEKMLKLRQEVCEKSAGVFLWVILVIPMLNATYDEGGNIAAMKELLQSLPSELDALFVEILAKSTEDMESCACLLQWVLFSTRPLTATELYVAMQSTSSKKIPNSIDCPESTRLNKFLLHCSRGLIEISKFEPYMVQFIHETVRSFLLSSKGLGQIAPKLSANAQGLSHTSLSSVCFQYVKRIPRRRSSNYLGYDDESAGDARGASLFLSYAVESMLSHADKAQQCGISQESFLLHLKSNQKNDLNRWCTLHNTFKRDDFRSYSARVPLIYILAEQSLPHLAQCLCEKALADVNVSGGQRGFALHAACAEGNNEILRMLLDSGAQIDVQGGEHEYTALSEACANSRLETVQLLLERGADPNAPAGDHGFALQAASCQPTTRLVRFLLSANANVNAQGGDFNTALQAASFYGHETVVKLLLEAGAEVSLLRGESQSALHAAAFSNQGDVMQLLLAADINVDIQQEGAETPLYTASAAGHEHTTKILLEAGADANVQGGEYGNALQAASLNGHETIARLLVRAKADVNLNGGEYGSALQAAAFGGYLDIVKGLLSCKADIHSEGGKYGSPLHAASAAGNTDIVEFLVQRGANVNASCKP